MGISTNLKVVQKNSRFSPFFWPAFRRLFLGNDSCECRNRGIPSNHATRLRTAPSGSSEPIPFPSLEGQLWLGRLGTDIGAELRNDGVSDHVLERCGSKLWTIHIAL